jgi:hypothetical protein
MNIVHIRASVGDQTMILLIDSGSSNTFVTRRFAERAGCLITPAPPVSVKVANGQLMLSDSQVAKLNWSYEGHTFTDAMRILDIGAYDAILGKDWLDRCGTMLCNWKQKILQFEHNGEQVTLKGLDIPKQQNLEEISVNQLQSMLATNKV